MEVWVTATFKPYLRNTFMEITSLTTLQTKQLKSFSNEELAKELNRQRPKEEEEGEEETVRDI